MTDQETDGQKLLPHQINLTNNQDATYNVEDNTGGNADDDLKKKKTIKIALISTAVLIVVTLAIVLPIVLISANPPYPPNLPAGKAPVYPPISQSYNTY